MGVYDAFISYSHAKDGPIARELQYVIQTLGKSWLERRAVRVFRDDSSLTASPELWPSIESALNQSEYLILLASPEAGASKWVDREVSWWLRNKKVDRLLIALTSGEINWEAAAGDFVRHDGCPLPPALIGQFDSEPFWIDLREWRERSARARRHTTFKSLASKIAARVRGMAPEDLWSEELRQQRRNVRLAYASIVTLSGLLIGAVVAGAVAWKQRNDATFGQLRQLEISAAQSLRQGDVVGAAYNVARVAESGDPRLTRPARVRTLAARFVPLDTLLKDTAEWSVFFWRDRLYIRGESADELYSIPGEAASRWLVFQHNIVLLDQEGHLTVFDIKHRRFGRKHTQSDRFGLCDIIFNGDKSVSIYGLSQSGVTLGGLSYVRWRVTDKGQVSYATDPYNSGTWHVLNICPNFRASAAYKLHVHQVPAFTFPKTKSETSLWTEKALPAVNNAALKKFFTVGKSGKIAFPWNDTVYEKKGPPPTSPDAIVHFLFCSGPTCLENRSIRAGRIGQTSALFGLQIYGMAGESYSLCLKSDVSGSVNCSELAFLYNNESLNGIRFFNDGRIVVAYGRSFGVNRVWGQHGTKPDTNIALSFGPKFSKWLNPAVPNTVGEILDASIDPTNTKLAVIALSGVYVFKLREQYPILRRMSKADATAICWLPNGNLALLSEKGVLRAFNPDGSGAWAPLDLGNLPFTAKQPGGERTWWMSCNAAARTILVGNGQQGIVIDGHLGGPITDPFSLEVDIERFRRPNLRVTKGGGLAIVANYKSFYRAGFGGGDGDLKKRLGFSGVADLGSLLAPASAVRN